MTIELRDARRWAETLAARHVRIAAGEALTVEGGPVDPHVYLIVAGEAALERRFAGGAREIARFVPGDLIGEGLLLAGDPATDAVLAMRPVEALVFDSARIEGSSDPADSAADAARSGLRRLLTAMRLRVCGPFGHVSSGELGDLVPQVRTLTLSAGAEPGPAGSPLEHLHIVQAGHVDVKVPARGDERVIARLGPGDHFGAAALIGGRDEPVHVAAVEGTTLLVVPYAAFDAWLTAHPDRLAAFEPEVATVSASVLLQRSPAFRSLDLATLRTLAAALVPVRQPVGSAVVVEGQPGTACYLVRSGEIELDTDERPDATRELARLGAGDVFGEGVVLSDDPHRYTAHALTDCELYALPRAACERLAGKHARFLEGLAGVLAERQLPRRIDHWSVAMHRSPDGEVYVLKDEARGRYIKLSERGYFLWQEIDGDKTLRDLVMAYFLRFRSLSVEAVLAQVDALRAAGFITVQEVSTRWLPPPATAPAWRRALGWGRLLLDWRFALDGLDVWVSRQYRNWGFVLFTPVARALMLIAVVLGTAALADMWRRRTLPPLGLEAAAGWDWLAFYGFVLAHAIAHEFAHAFAVKAHGREVRRAGGGIFWGVPILYVDTSDIWMSNRRARIAVSWAGPYLHLVIASSLAIAAWWSGGTVPPVLAQAMALNYLFFVFNLFPLLEYDGYYMLMDYVEIPQLRRKALMLLRGGVWRAWREGRWGRTETVLLAFGVVSGAYSLLMTTQLVRWIGRLGQILVAPVFGPGAGVAAGWTAAAAAALALLPPALRDLRGAMAAPPAVSPPSGG